LYRKYNFVVRTLQRTPAHRKSVAYGLEEGRMLATLAPGQFQINILEELGRGGLGQVNRVRIINTANSGLSLGTDWAIKRLNDRWKQVPEARERFEREIRTLSKLSHPNIIGLLGASLPGYERFYLMPLYRHSVRKMIQRGGLRNDLRRVAAYGVVLAEALWHAHQMGLVHRDIKPDNLLFNANGPLVVADWGIGYFIHQQSIVLHQLTRAGMGTEYYCSAEQWATGRCDARGDIYSLGMTLDEWLNGRQRQLSSIGCGLSQLRRLNATPAARALEELLVTMTSRLASGRPQTMFAVAQRLRYISSLAS
jgi:serine/threonine protein kinase